jgi:hypothetical protein
VCTLMNPKEILRTSFQRTSDQYHVHQHLFAARHLGDYDLYNDISILIEKKIKSGIFSPKNWSFDRYVSEHPRFTSDYASEVLSKEDALIPCLNGEYERCLEIAKNDGEREDILLAMALKGESLLDLEAQLNQLGWVRESRNEYRWNNLLRVFAIEAQRNSRLGYLETVLSKYAFEIQPKMGIIEAVALSDFVPYVGYPFVDW